MRNPARTSLRAAALPHLPQRPLHPVEVPLPGPPGARRPASPCPPPGASCRRRTERPPPPPPGWCRAASSWTTSCARSPSSPSPRTARERLSRRANGSCPGAGWKPSKKYKLLSYDRKGARKGKIRPDISVCTDALDIRFHELQLMRLEHRIPLNFVSLRSSHPLEDRRYHTYLFLGAEGFPTGSRPTYYQTPLVPSQAVQCPTCLAVAKASLTSPPILSSGPYNTDVADLNGQWISLRCEVRPYGLFLRRTFTFDDAWQAQHSYYRDPHCKHPMFVLSATGLYFRGMPSTVVLNAIEYDFHVQEVFLTPKISSSSAISTVCTRADRTGRLAKEAT
ncbi:protein APCDD1 [Caerostris extrusa]|uniref:Protein APCDD1 n=1 Tax=Caerostris extrusa TaxID=172846 RepID=A0AAV4N495_CAEEX|nr:protein APCDD1 [Caerostris extrusa]